MRHRRAFTLVELLVVIGIIALLLGILLPVLQKARDYGYRTACLNNHKQLLAAIYMYANDANGYLPNPNDDGTTAWMGPGWLYDMRRGAIPTPKQSEVEYGALWPYLKRHAVYHCPAEEPPYTRGPAHPLTSYLMNWAVGGYGTGVIKKTVPAYKLVKMRRDGIVFWEGDERNKDVNMYSDGTNEPPNGITRRHGAGATVSRFDGGAEWMARQEYDREATRKPGRLYCNPGMANGYK